MLTRRHFTAATLGTPALLAAGRAPQKAKKLQESPATSAVTELGGFAGQRLALNRTHRLEKFDIDTYVKMVEEKKHRDWWWIGEQPGKWLEAAILASAGEPESALHKKAEQVLARMIAAQDPDGYMGITDPAMRSRRRPFRGMDPYELYFTLHALVTAHEYWGSAPALSAAKKLGDFFLAKIGPGPDKSEFWPLPRPVTLAGHEVHYSLEGTLLLDPMMRLYEVSNESRYLEWCEWVIKSIDRWSASDTYSNLDEVAAGRMNLNQIQPNVHAHTLHMNMLGFLGYYRATGDASVVRKVQGAWRNIMANYRYITGGVSVAEGYKEPHQLPNTGSVVETCATMSWLLLNQALLELTSEPAYGDAMEALLWNHLFAAQTVDGDGFRYHCALNGFKPDGYFTGPDCCSASGARILAQLPTMIYGQAKESVFVNQFIASAAKFEKISLRQSTDFPAGERVTITVGAPQPAAVTLRVRIPEWAKGATVAVNGTAVKDVTPGAYCTMRHTWSNGDRIDLRLPMAPEWVKGEYTNSGMVALRRGPVVYMLEDQPAHTAIDVNQTLTATASSGLGPDYQTDALLPNTDPTRIRLTPFANLGRWYRSEAERAATPMPKDRRGMTEKKIPYAVWLKQA